MCHNHTCNSPLSTTDLAVAIFFVLAHDFTVSMTKHITNKNTAHTPIETPITSLVLETEFASA